jgi:hypothetical protein
MLVVTSGSEIPFRCMNSAPCELLSTETVFPNMFVKLRLFNVSPNAEN